MSNALGRAAQFLQAELDEHGIIVNEAERYIRWHGMEIVVSYGTPKHICLRKLRKIIRAAEELKRKEALEKQETLL
jgi:hypothetical protein